jgi:hypothetical protein
LFDKTTTSFEYLDVTISPRKENAVRIITVYRPPPSTKNKFTVAMFMDEFSAFISDILTAKENLLILGDFNFHVDDAACSKAKQFIKLIDSFCLDQHVNQTTHEDGHILDLVMTRSNCELVSNFSVLDTGVSDHYWVHFLLNQKIQEKPKNAVSYRKINSIDQQKFKKDIVTSALKIISSSSCEEAFEKYNKLQNLLDLHAPLITKNITIHPDTPWFNKEIHESKCLRRKYERRWRKSKKDHDRNIYLEQKQIVIDKIKIAKESYYRGQVEACNDQKDLYKIVDELLNRKNINVLPTFESPKAMADCFSEFFREKIARIRHELENVRSINPDSDKEIQPVVSYLEHLAPTTVEELTKIVMSTKSKSCSLDPIPTTLLKEHIDVLAPSLVEIVNLSFKEGSIPSSEKRALVRPLLKKKDLDAENLKNYRPVSNLSYLSKLVERIAAKRLNEHMSINNLNEKFQSAYKPQHSCETALLRVQSDILEAVDNKKCILLVLLDLSAAFDTIDHSTLMKRLHNIFGLRGSAYMWFDNYLKNRTQSVIIDDKQSALWTLLFGVPQGSVLGPLLFILYTSPLGKLLRDLGVMYHFYADDTQIYLSFDLLNIGDAISKMENVISKVREWMADNFLCLNDDKTEFMVITSDRRLSKLASHVPVIHIGEESINTSPHARNIGFIFDQTLSLDKQIASTCKSAWFHLKNLSRIKNYLDRVSLERLIHAFVSSKLDVNNSLYFGLPDCTLNKLQLIQNASARILTGVRKYDHITDTLIQLHWLPIKMRIMYKIILLTFKALHNLAPVYIREMIKAKPEPRVVRSNGKNYLVPSANAKTKYGSRGFRCASAQLWTDIISQDLRDTHSLTDFKRKLKTELFRLAYF